MDHLEVVNGVPVTGDSDSALTWQSVDADAPSSRPSQLHVCIPQI